VYSTKLPLDGEYPEQKATPSSPMLVITPEAVMEESPLTVSGVYVPPTWPTGTWVEVGAVIVPNPPFAGLTGADSPTVTVLLLPPPVSPVPALIVLIPPPLPPPPPELAVVKATEQVTVGDVPPERVAGTHPTKRTGFPVTDWIEPDVLEVSSWTQLTLSTDPMKLTVKPDGDPVVVTSHVNPPGSCPFGAGRAKDVHPVAVPGFALVAAFTALQETVKPPAIALALPCAHAEPTSSRGINQRSFTLDLLFASCDV
jgi:hypothetical protein